MLVHESGHYIAAASSGAKLYRIHVSPLGGGHVLHNGGWNWLIAPAGYVGTLLYGAFLFRCSASPSAARVGLAVTAVFIVLYGGAAGAGSSAVIGSFVLFLMWIGAAFWTLNGTFQCATARIFATILSADGVISLYDVLFGYDWLRKQSIWAPVSAKPDYDQFFTDATNMAWAYGHSEGFWAVVWLVISVLALLLGLIWSIRAEQRHKLEATGAASVLPSLREFEKGVGTHEIS